MSLISTLANPFASSAVEKRCATKACLDFARHERSLWIGRHA